MSSTLMLLALVQSFLSEEVVRLFNTVAPEPYMDEIFHNKQTQAYLSGNWTYWHPKITTPPGLYLLVSFIVRALSMLGISPHAVSVSQLRFLNCLLYGLNSYLLLCILNLPPFLLRGSQNRCSHLLNSFSISSLPILFFTSLLFYTDQCSLTFVLLSFISFYGGHFALTFLFSAFSLLCRQTNVVWCFFTVCIALSNGLEDCIKRRYRQKGLFSEVSELLHAPRKTFMIILRCCLVDVPHLILVLFGFVLFVYLNGGVTLGDKLAHRPCFHLQQMFYFFAFSALMTPLRFCVFCLYSLRHFSTLITSRRRLLQFTILSSALLLVGVVSVRFCTVEHPYLLADNRHYIFYIWRRFYRSHPLLPYLMVPFYIISGFYIFHCFMPRAKPYKIFDFLNFLSFMFCTGACLIPAPLIEFRYFIMPFIVWRLYSIYSQQNLRIATFLEVILNICINMFTVYMFVYKPFKWPTELNVLQRFMW